MFLLKSHLQFDHLCISLVCWGLLVEMLDRLVSFQTLCGGCWQQSAMCVSRGFSVHVVGLFYCFLFIAAYITSLVEKVES